MRMRAPLILSALLFTAAVGWFLSHERVDRVGPQNQPKDVVESKPHTPMTSTVSMGDLSLQSPLLAESLLATAAAKPRPSLPLSERMRTDTEGLTVVEHPDGRRSMHLQGRFQHMSARQLDHDGHAQVQCFHDHDAMHDHIHGHAHVHEEPQQVSPYPHM